MFIKEGFGSRDGFKGEDIIIQVFPRFKVLIANANILDYILSEFFLYMCLYCYHQLSRAWHSAWPLIGTK